MALPLPKTSITLPSRVNDATVGIGSNFSQNPLLVPRTDPGLLTTLGNGNTGGATVPFQPQSGLLISTDLDDFLNGNGLALVANGRAVGVNTVTIGGTSLATDVINLIFTSQLFPGGSFTLSCASQAGDTVNGKTAERMAATINANAVLHGYGISANVVGQTSIVNINWPGPLGLYTVLTSAIITGTPTATVGTPSWVGGSGPVIPWVNTNTMINGQVYTMQVGQPLLLPLSTVGLMVNQGIPLT